MSRPLQMLSSVLAWTLYSSHGQLHKLTDVLLFFGYLLSYFRVLLLVHLCILYRFVLIYATEIHCGLGLFDRAGWPFNINARTLTCACTSWCIPELPDPSSPFQSHTTPGPPKTHSWVNELWPWVRAGLSQSCLWWNWTHSLPIFSLEP